MKRNENNLQGVKDKISSRDVMKEELDLKEKTDEEVDQKSRDEDVTKETQDPDEEVKEMQVMDEKQNIAEDSNAEQKTPAREAETNEVDQEAEEDLVTLDIQDIIAAEAKPSSKARSRASNFRIVNTKKHGRRITLSKDLIDYLGTEEIEIGFTKTDMILAQKGTGISKEAFKLRAHGKSQYILYSTPLVIEATKFFELDFSNCTTNGLETNKTKLTGGAKAIIVGL